MSNESDRTERRVGWISRRLPILARIERDFSSARPFGGLSVGICLHIEPKTAALCRVLAAGGARVTITGNFGTTQSDMADYLRDTGVTVCHRPADDRRAHRANLVRVAGTRPDLIIDNGAELLAVLDRTANANLIAGTEETTSGADRLRDGRAGAGWFPVVVINDSPLKRIVENQYGVGQTLVEAFMRTTNLAVPGKRVVVSGYGWVGRGIVRSFDAFGARLCVVEPDPIKALEAAMDGFRVARLDQVLSWGEVFVTATARPRVITAGQMQGMRDGVILANAGHFSTELDLAGLGEMSDHVHLVSDHITEYVLPDGRRLTVLAGGEMLNLAAGGGNPAETMDLGLALQALSLRWLLDNHADLPAGPRPVPEEINRKVAQMMLEQMFADPSTKPGEPQPTSLVTRLLSHTKATAAPPAIRTS